MFKIKKMVKQGGFTLFELLVSISIIAILTALATISYSSAQKKARDTKRVQDMDSFQKAEEQYYMLHNSVYNLSNFSPGRQWTDLNGNIIFVTPGDPKGGSYLGNALPADLTKYCVCAMLENTTSGNSGDNCVWAANGPDYCVTSQQ